MANSCCCDPRKSGSNLAAVGWRAAMLLIGGGVGIWLSARPRVRPAADARTALSAEEQARLREILED